MAAAGAEAQEEFPKLGRMSPVVVSAVALSNHPAGFRFALREARRMGALPCRHLPEVDMGDIYRKLFLVPPRLPTRCNATASWSPCHDEGYCLAGAWGGLNGTRFGVLPCRSSEAIYPEGAGQLTSVFRGSVLVRRDSAT
ncbi:hypothetical protein GCM10010372_05850 [Streptomyces tauricus]|nr:hypothetical protein GCM10010372_05850 [Streptomyces tauricus]